MMNTTDFDPAKVIYLLEPEDPIAVEAAKSLQYNSIKKVQQYALERTVDLSPEYNGEWVMGEEMRIWRVHIISPQALSIGVLFSDFELNEGVRLFIYDEAGEYIKGAFTSHNNKDFGSLFVSHIPGEQVIIELQVDNDVRDYGSLRIGSVSHAVVPIKGLKTGLGQSQACEIDVNCSEGDDWQLIKKSLVQIETPKLLCTGTLVNNTSYNGTPYIITAEHCLNEKFYPRNSVFTFRFENSECFGDDASMEKSVSGAELIATGDSIDFTLVQLTKRPPRDYDVFYAGWDRRETNFASSVTLHHPNADAMKISFDFDPMDTPTSVPGDLNDYVVASNFWIKQWDIGTTEGGSSGGPLFNDKKRLIGVLSGGLAACGKAIGYDEELDRTIYSLLDNKNDYYSRLYYSWDYYSEDEKQLKKWLDPGNTGKVALGGLAGRALDIQQTGLPDKMFRIYPNPTEGNFNIHFPDLYAGPIDLKVYSISGSLLHHQERSFDYTLNLDLGFLQNGLYLIHISGEGFTASERLIIER